MLQCWLTIFLLGSVCALNAQVVRDGKFWIPIRIENGDTLTDYFATEVGLEVLPISKEQFASDTGWQTLIADIKKCYPVCRQMAEGMNAVDKNSTKTRSGKIKDIDTAGLAAGYDTSKLTFTLDSINMRQAILISKLLSRETGKSVYEVLRMFAGPVKAGIIQSAAKLHGFDLKVDYSPLKESAIEAALIEAGF